MAKNNNFNFTVFSKETIDKQFDEIQATLKPSMNYKLILKEFHRILHNRVLPTLIYDSKSDEFTVFRITKPWNNFDKDNPNSYSYNPEPKDNGRAHRIGFPVFYGSIDPYTSFSEMKDSLKINDTFYLSRWKLKFKTDINVHTLIINSSTKNSDHILNSVIKRLHQGLKDMVKNVPDDFKDGYIYAVEKMGDLFATKGSSNYHITSAYSHEILYEAKSKGINIPIILYPSVENSLNSINWAIHPSVVNSDEMRLQDVFELSLKENNTSNNKGDLSVLIHKKGTASETKINWQTPHFTDFKIDYDNLTVRTYSNEVVRGKKVSGIKLNDTNVSIRNLIDNNIDKNQVQKKLPEITSNSQKDSELDFKNETFNWNLLLKLEHGNEIETSKGKSCINLIQVPISWTRKYKTTK
jgi:hypothetical protein